MYTIIIPASAIPLLISLGYHQRKASKAGMISNKDKNSSLFRDPVALFSQLDIFGLLLFTAGITLVLLPMTLAARYPNRWASSHIIAMLVVGIVCLLAFPVWEVKFAKTPILSLDLLKDRTVLGGCGGMFFDPISSLAVLRQTWGNSCLLCVLRLLHLPALLLLLPRRRAWPLLQSGYQHCPCE